MPGCSRYRGRCAALLGSVLLVLILVAVGAAGSIQMTRAAAMSAVPLAAAADSTTPDPPDPQEGSDSPAPQESSDPPSPADSTDAPAPSESSDEPIPSDSSDDSTSEPPQVSGTYRTNVWSRADGQTLDLGGEVTVSADITCELYEQTFRLSGYVHFEVTGANATDSGTLPVGHGAASWSYRGVVAGVDRITAIVDKVSDETCGPDPQPAAGSDVSVTWNPAAAAATLDLTTDPTGPTLVGDSFNAAASLSRDGAPVSDVQVSFSGSDGQEGAARTDAEGRAGFTLRCMAPGDITVKAAATVDEQDISDTTTHTCVQPTPDLTLQPDKASSSFPGNYPLTATLTAGGTPVPGITVHATASPGGAVASGITDLDGHVTLLLACERSGTVTVTVTATVYERDLSASVQHSCVATHGLSLTLAPAGTTTVLGSPFTVTATLLDNKAPVVGYDLSITALESGRDPLTLSGTTDQTGNASFTYTRNRPGMERITSSATVDGVRVQTTIAHYWKAAGGITVTLSPAGTSSVVQSPFEATARVTFAGRPVPAARVSFRGTMPGAAVRQTVSATDINGYATFVGTRPTAGTETISATATVSGHTGTATVVHFWTPDRGIALGLAPGGTTTAVRTPFTATATVTRAAGAAGLRVTFRVSGVGGALTGSATTNRRGTATYTYSRAAAGTDTVSAAVAVSGRSAAASIVHGWTMLRVPPPPPPDGGPRPRLHLGNPAVPPGGDVRATGIGCRSGARVTLMLGSTPAGTTTADRSGTYRTVLRIPALPIGHYTVTATCGKRVSQAPLDLVGVTSGTGTAGAAATTTAAVFSFFVLLGAQLLRGGGIGAIPGAGS